MCDLLFYDINDNFFLNLAQYNIRLSLTIIITKCKGRRFRILVYLQQSLTDWLSHWDTSPPDSVRFDQIEIAYL